jgi:hypothetical protein
MCCKREKKECKPLWEGLLEEHLVGKSNGLGLFNSSGLFRSNQLVQDRFGNYSTVHSRKNNAIGKPCTFSGRKDISNVYCLACL